MHWSCCPWKVNTGHSGRHLDARVIWSPAFPGCTVLSLGHPMLNGLNAMSFGASLCSCDLLYSRQSRDMGYSQRHAFDLQSTQCLASITATHSTPASNAHVDLSLKSYQWPPPMLRESASCLDVWIYRDEGKLL